MIEVLPWRDDGPAEGCGCECSASGDVLAVDATGCATGDPLADEDCRAALVGGLRGRTVARVRISALGRETVLEGASAALFVAASRFAERVADQDDRLARRALRDPLAGAQRASARAGPVGDLVEETGLAARASGVDAYGSLRRFVGPTLARVRVDPVPPPDARLRETPTLSSAAEARCYRVPGQELETYHLDPPSARLDHRGFRTLARARRHLADTGTSPRRAVRAVADADEDVDTLARVLEKHTRGYGVLADLFADPAVTDVTASSPASGAPLRLCRNGESMRTNLRLGADGAAALASRLRRDGGRAFSRASPTVDAHTEVAGRSVRAAGLTEPASEGYGFALRAHDAVPRTLPGLVANGTLSARTAGLLSVAVERDAALLVAGARGAGKTTLLGALCWELPAATRLVVLEDTPELPVGPLGDAGRDVQPVRTAVGDGRGLAPTAALRTALRLGESALVVGEVRGEEAAVLYEAMRIGASGSAVLGTIHGEGAAGVRERVVADLGVPASSFAATDLVVTLAADAGAHRVAAIEEVLRGDDGPTAAPLRAAGDAPGRLDRGNSVVAGTLARPGETYADVLEAVRRRTDHLADLADRGVTDPDDVVDAHAARRTGEVSAP
ncbi:MAG: ATPase, T2SS/T4P/T4SS family [Halobacteriaceae archaeon]